MDRMRHFTAMLTLSAGLLGLGASPAAAALLKPGATRSYPDIAADINGKVIYNYDEATNTGIFDVTNTPYLIAGGSTASSEFAVNPGSDGIRSQLFRIKVDGAGNLVADAGNTYELYGSITAGDQTFSGLLLKGTPKEFGSLDLDGVLGAASTTGLGVDIFDANIDITGGSLARFFGTSAYLRITPELESTFAGSFSEDFTALKATSNTRSYGSPEPFPIPEPTAVAILLAGGAAFLYRRRRRAG